MVKKLTFFLIVFCSFLSINGLERAKPLPLSELQNKNGLMYVPIPYPKTDEEVIVDLKYYLQQTINQKYLRSVIIGSNEGDIYFHENAKQYIEGNENLSVADIIKVQNYDFRRRYEYSFLIELNKPGVGIIMRVSLADAGYWLTTAFADSSFNPLKPVRDVVNDNNNLNEMIKQGLLTREAIKNSEAVAYLFLGDPDEPFFRILGTDMQEYFVGSFGSVYRVELSKSFSDIPKRVNSANSVFQVIAQAQLRQNETPADLIYFVDTISDKDVYIKKIK